MSTSEESFIGRRHLPLEPRAVHTTATPVTAAAAAAASEPAAGGAVLRAFPCGSFAPPPAPSGRWRLPRDAEAQGRCATRPGSHSRREAHPALGPGGLTSQPVPWALRGCERFLVLFSLQGPTCDGRGHGDAGKLTRPHAR